MPNTGSVAGEVLAGWGSTLIPEHDVGPENAPPGDDVASRQPARVSPPSVAIRNSVSCQGLHWLIEGWADEPGAMSCASLGISGMPGIPGML